MQSPMTKAAESRSGRLRDRASPDPICSPIGDIAISAPIPNSPIPATITAAERRKTVTSRGERETTGVRDRTKTISATGNTEISDSRSFRISTLITVVPPFPGVVPSIQNHYSIARRRLQPHGRFFRGKIKAKKTPPPIPRHPDFLFFTLVKRRQIWYNEGKDAKGSEGRYGYGTRSAVPGGETPSL